MTQKTTRGRHRAPISPPLFILLGICASIVVAAGAVALAVGMWA